MLIDISTKVSCCLQHLWLGYLLTTTEATDNLAIVTQIDETLQTVQQRVIIEIQYFVVDDECIELIAWLEATHLAEEAASRLRSNPEDFGQREERLALVLLVLHLADLDGVYQHAEHVQVVTTTDVAAQADGQTLVEECANGCQT